MSQLKIGRVLRVFAGCLFAIFSTIIQQKKTYCKYFKYKFYKIREKGNDRPVDPRFGGVYFRLFRRRSRNVYIDSITCKV